MQQPQPEPQREPKRESQPELQREPQREPQPEPQPREGVATRGDALRGVTKGARGGTRDARHVLLTPPNTLLLHLCLPGALT